MPFRRKYNPTFSQITSIFSLIRKLFVKKSELLTFGLQKRVVFALLVGGFFPQVLVNFLRRLSAGAGELTMGSDVFLNCFALEDLIIRATPEQATGLFALVGSITEAVRALFWPVGEAAPRAGLWYPAYWEDIEETPAHILLHTFSGQGYHYRQCFLENKLLPAEYDAIFPQGHDADDASVMAMLCFDRLRWPWQLSDAARDAYRDFLKTNTGRVLTRLLKAQDTEGIKALLALDVLDKAGFASAAALAAKAESAAAAALLADAEHKKYAPQPQKQRYDFDF